MRSSEKYPNCQGGLTLIEVLIAVAVLSIGLLGLAGLQTIGLRNNHGAYLRSQATLFANDMIDRIHANPRGVAGNAYDDISGIPENPGCTSSGCTAIQMAQLDAHEWNTMLAALFPSGHGTVGGAGKDSVFTITVMWDEGRCGATQCSSAADDEGDSEDEDACFLKCFSVSIQP